MSVSAGCRADTMGAIPKVYYDTGVEVYKPLAMEGEGGEPPRHRWHLGCILLKMPDIMCRQD